MNKYMKKSGFMFLVMLCMGILCTTVSASIYPRIENGLINIHGTDITEDVFSDAFIYHNECNELKNTKNYYAQPQIDRGAVKIKASVGKDSDFGFSVSSIGKRKKFMVSYKLKAMQTNQMLTTGFNGWYEKNDATEPAVSGIYFGQNGKMGYAPNAVWHNGNSAVEREYSKNKWYSFDTVYDLENRKATYYVDGEFWGETSLHEKVLNSDVASVIFQIRNSAGPNDGSGVFYIDDVSVISLDENSFFAKYSACDGYIKVRFSQGLAKGTLFAPQIKDENGNSVAVKETSVSDDGQYLYIYYKNGFEWEEEKEYTLSLGEEITSVCGQTLENPQTVLCQRYTSIQVYAPQKSYADLALAQNKMQVLAYQSQTLTSLSGEFDFKFGLLDEGEYTAYIYNDMLESPVELKIYNRAKTPVFESDFEVYSNSGLPTDWTYCSNNSLLYSDNGMMKIDAGLSDISVFKEFSDELCGGLSHIGFDLTQSTQGNVDLILLEEYTQAIDEKNSYKTLRIGADGYIGYFIEQCEEKFLSVNDMRFDKNRNYRFDIWFDWDTKRVTYMVDGVVLGRSPLNAELSKIEGIAFLASKGKDGSCVYLDNVVADNIPYDYAGFLSDCGENIPKELGEDFGISITTDKTGNILSNKKDSFTVSVFARNTSGPKILRTQITKKGEPVWQSNEEITLSEGENTFVITPMLTQFGLFEFSAEIGNVCEKVDFSFINAPSKGVKNSDFGICDHTSPEYGNAKTIAELNTQAGFGIVRSGLHWEYYQTDENTFETPFWFSEYCSVVEENEVEHIMTLGWDCPQIGVTGAPDDKNELEAFAVYAENIAREYKDRGKYYEIWNEYPLSTQNDRDKYLTMMSYIYPALKRGDPDAVVFGVVAKHTEYDYIDELLQSGATAYMDGLSIHQYCESNTPEAGGMLGDGVKKIRTFMDNNGMEDCELWMTEYGWNKTNVTPSQQAAYLVRTAVMNDESKLVSKLIVYNSIKKHMLKNTNTSEYEYGILNSANADVPYSATEAYPALCNYNAMLSQASCTGKTEKDGVYKYFYTDQNGDAITVMWADKENVQTVIDGLDSNAYICDIYGNRELAEVSDAGSVTFNLGISPVYLIEKNSPEISVIKNGETVLSSELNANDEAVLAVKLPSKICETNTDIEVYVAQYDNNVLNDVKTAQVSDEGDAYVPVTYKGGSVRVYVWNKQTLTPLTWAYSLIK